MSVGLVLVFEKSTTALFIRPREAEASIYPHSALHTQLGFCNLIIFLEAWCRGPEENTKQIKCIQFLKLPRRISASPHRDRVSWEAVEWQRRREFFLSSEHCDPMGHFLPSWPSGDLEPPASRSKAFCLLISSQHCPAPQAVVLMLSRASES